MSTMTRAAAGAARCALAALALAAALAGCTATGGGARQAGMPDSQQGDASVVTVFGTVDANVTTQRSR